MADNTRVFVAGAGDDIRTRDRAGPKTQVVSLDVAGVGEAELLGAGPRHSVIKVDSAGMTLTGGTAYTTGDVLGTELIFPGAARANGRGCRVISALLIDNAKILSVAVTQEVARLWLFSAPSTPAADNAPPSWTDANMTLLVGVIAFGGAVAGEGRPAAMANNNVLLANGPPAGGPYGLPIVAQPAGTSLYGVLTCHAAAAALPAAQAALTVILGIAAD